MAKYPAGWFRSLFKYWSVLVVLVFGVIFSGMIQISSDWWLRLSDNSTVLFYLLLVSGPGLFALACKILIWLIKEGCSIPFCWNPGWIFLVVVGMAAEITSLLYLCVKALLEIYFYAAVLSS